MSIFLPILPSYVSTALYLSTYIHIYIYFYLICHLACEGCEDGLVVVTRRIPSVPDLGDVMRKLTRDDGAREAGLGFIRSQGILIWYKLYVVHGIWYTAHSI